MHVRACILVAVTASLAWAQADLILHNGKIVTVDRNFSIAQAVAVQGDRIIAVGNNAAVMKQRGARTQVIDLKGRAVLPGLIDAHVHALGAGLSEFREPLPPLDSFPAVQKYIRERAAKTPAGSWIVVPRTFPTRLKELRMPTREVLDVDREHPVMFDASYTVIVNSYALKMSGITRDTPNPPGGEIVKDETGEPNGILKNAQSLLKGLRRAERFTDAEMQQALEDMLKRYAAAGLTTIGDRAVTPADVALYEKLKGAGRLPVRVELTWRIDASRPIEAIREEINSRPWKTGVGDDWLRFGTFKVTLDGGMTIGTAYQRRPYGPFGRQLYGQTDPENRGQLFIAPDKLVSIFKIARDKGWQLTAHSQGGGAVDVFLDAMAALDKDSPIAPTRSHLMHASFQSRQAILRAKEMGILADVQPVWLYLDAPALEQVFSYEALRYFIPLRTYIDAGVIVAGGSDHMTGFDKNKAVNPYNPFLGMWIAVARKTNRGKVIWPEERITRAEALKMWTVWPAYLQFSEKEKGSIEAGKLADLVVTDRDPLTCPEDQIKDTEPVMTVIGGKIAYRKQ